jgi:hypothetical protein
MAYVGDTRSRALLARCRAEGVGQIIVRGRLKGRRLERWAYDNGAFEDWRHGRPFDDAQFRADLVAMSSGPAPDFVVLPDIVAGGLDSLALSMRYLAELPRQDWYLAVQDGMTPEDVPWACGIAGIFVGGTLEWKLGAGAAWVAAAHDHGLRCHVGRVGTRRRVAWAKASGADSVDSCLPMWSRANARAFFDGLRQADLFGDQRAKAEGRR